MTSLFEYVKSGHTDPAVVNYACKDRAAGSSLHRFVVDYTLLLARSDGEGFVSVVKGALPDFLVDITAAMLERFNNRLDKMVILRKYTKSVD